MAGFAFSFHSSFVGSSGSLVSFNLSFEDGCESGSLFGHESLMMVSLEVGEGLMSSMGNKSLVLLEEFGSGGQGSLVGLFRVKEREVSKVLVSSGGFLLFFLAVSLLLVPVVGTVFRAYTTFVLGAPPAFSAVPGETLAFRVGGAESTDSSMALESTLNIVVSVTTVATSLLVGGSADFL